MVGRDGTNGANLLTSRSTWIELGIQLELQISGIAP